MPAVDDEQVRAAAEALGERPGDEGEDAEEHHARR